MWIWTCLPFWLQNEAATRSTSFECQVTGIPVTATWPQGKVRCSAWAIADSGAGIKAVPWPHGPPLKPLFMEESLVLICVDAEIAPTLSLDVIGKNSQHHNDWFIRLLFLWLVQSPVIVNIPLAHSVSIMKLNSEFRMILEQHINIFPYVHDDGIFISSMIM